jgi:hypothetical protein
MLICKGPLLDMLNLKGQIVPKSDWEQVRRWAWDPFLSASELSPANLRSAFFDTATNLDKVILGEKRYGFVFLVDIHWGGTNLSVVNWASVSILGDEREARQHKMAGGKTKDKTTRLKEYQTAVRANRQLAAALRDQGLNEEAIRFAYQAQRLQRVVFRRQMLERGIAFSQRVKMFFSWVFSLILDVLAGYGYHPWKSIGAYLVTIFGFMGLYLLNSHFTAPHLRWDEALVLSLSSFHGRGFFSQNVTLGDTYARLAAAEAVSGLLIEISFIAAFTQRFLESNSFSCEGVSKGSASGRGVDLPKLTVN